MGVSGKCWNAHVQHWEKTLFNYRKIWPSRLFRHEPIENAIKILSAGQLLSRNAAGAQIVTDIAPDGIIGCTDAAYDSVRLYFRPRNPTQYHIEGIRRPTEYYHGKHGGVLIMFVFSAGEIMTRGDVRFSDGNMQSHATQVLDGDQSFSSLDFKKIYHDSAQNDPDIVRSRCAEVLVPSPLNISENLEYILVRSDADRITLLEHLREKNLGEFSSKVRVAVKQGIFFADYPCVEFVDVVGSEIKFGIQPRRKGGAVKTKLILRALDGSKILRSTEEFEADPTGRWRWDATIANSGCYLEIWLEGILAHRNIVSLG